VLSTLHSPILNASWCAGVSECIAEDVSPSRIDCAIISALLTHAWTYVHISVCAISTHGFAHSCGICICILRID